MKKTRTAGLLFLFGGGVYTALELLTRQRTYFSMFCAGGCSLVLIDRWCNGRSRTQPLALRCCKGAAAVTLVELLFGLAFNRKHQEWDYSAQPLNLWGQICLPFSLLWSLLSVPAMGVSAHMTHALARRR